jgi:hypothetical protein
MHSFLIIKSIFTAAEPVWCRIRIVVVFEGEKERQKSNLQGGYYKEYRKKNQCGEKHKSPRQKSAWGFCYKKTAVTYSPTQSPVQYHRR